MPKRKASSIIDDKEEQGNNNVPGTPRRSKEGSSILSSSSSSSPAAAGVRTRSARKGRQRFNNESSSSSITKDATTTTTFPPAAKRRKRSSTLHPRQQKQQKSGGGGRTNNNSSSSSTSKKLVLDQEPFTTDDDDDDDDTQMTIASTEDNNNNQQEDLKPKANNGHNNNSHIASSLSLPTVLENTIFEMENDAADYDAIMMEPIMMEPTTATVATTHAPVATVASVMPPPPNTTTTTTINGDDQPTVQLLKPISKLQMSSNKHTPTTSIAESSSSLHQLQFVKNVPTHELYELPSLPPPPPPPAAAATTTTTTAATVPAAAAAALRLSEESRTDPNEKKKTLESATKPTTTTPGTTSVESPLGVANADLTFILGGQEEQEEMQQRQQQHQQVVAVGWYPFMLESVIAFAYSIQQMMTNIVMIPPSSLQYANNNNDDDDDDYDDEQVLMEVHEEQQHQQQSNPIWTRVLFWWVFWFVLQLFAGRPFVIHTIEETSERSRLFYQRLLLKTTESIIINTINMDNVVTTIEETSPQQQQEQELSSASPPPPPPVVGVGVVVIDDDNNNVEDTNKNTVHNQEDDDDVVVQQLLDKLQQRLIMVLDTTQQQQQQQQEGTLELLETPSSSSSSIESMEQSLKIIRGRLHERRIALHDWKDGIQSVQVALQDLATCQEMEKVPSLFFRANELFGFFQDMVPPELPTELLDTTTSHVFLWKPTFAIPPSSSSSSSASSSCSNVPTDESLNNDALLTPEQLETAKHELRQLTLTSASSLMQDETVLQSVRAWIRNVLTKKQNATSPPTTTTTTELTKGGALDVIANRLEIYQADQTGRLDYAAVYAGGTVIRHGVRATSPSLVDSLPLINRLLQQAKLRFYGYGPEAALTPTFPLDHSLGQCWAFDKQTSITPNDDLSLGGRYATLTVRLAEPTYVTSVVMEHAPKELTDQFQTAIQDFRILGFEDDNGSGDAWYLGSFRYEIDAPRTLQEFAVATTSINDDPFPRFRSVTLAIDSNWGFAYSCLYRFRVHGTEESDRIVKEEYDGDAEEDEWDDDYEQEYAEHDEND